MKMVDQGSEKQGMQGGGGSSSNLTILVTGANSGMGFECAKAFLSMNHNVIVCCRTLEKATAVIQKLSSQSTSTSTLTPIAMDLTSLHSVVRGARAAVVAHPVIDVLVLNAGIMNAPYVVTRDGFESMFQVNYMSHFVLFQAVKDAMLGGGAGAGAGAGVWGSGIAMLAGESDGDGDRRKHAHEHRDVLWGVPRVVSVSSLSSEKARVDSVQEWQKVALQGAQRNQFDKGNKKENNSIGSTGIHVQELPENEMHFDSMQTYREAKLAQVLFTRELHHRFRNQGLMSFAVHPGVVNTDLFYKGWSPILTALVQPLAWLGYLSGKLKTPAQGAQTAIYLSSTPLSQLRQDLTSRDFSVSIPIPVHSSEPPTNTHTHIKTDSDSDPDSNYARQQLSGLYWANQKPRTPNPLVLNKQLCRELWEWSEAVYQEVVDQEQATEEGRAKS